MVEAGSKSEECSRTSGPDTAANGGPTKPVVELVVKNPMRNDEVVEEGLESRANELRKELQEIERRLGVCHEGSLDEYFATPALRLLRSRLPWLIMLLIIQSSAALIMSRFEGLLDRHIVIAFFLPMIVGTGGNAGNQPGVMVTRALSIGGITPRALRRLLRREAFMALVTGTFLGLISFARVLAQFPAKKKEALAIAISVFLMVNLAICIGVTFTVAIDKLADPANGAAPLLTTVSDLIGISLLCLVSTLVLSSTSISALFGG